MTASHGFRSLPALLRHRVGETPDRDAFYYPDANENWQTLSWADVGKRVRAIASGLRALGIEHEERAAILSTTRVDWIIADLGILAAGGATTTIYPSNTPEECEYIITDSNTKFVFAENSEQVAKLRQNKESLGVTKVITIDPVESDDDWVIGIDELERMGRERDEADPEAYDAVIEAIEPSHLATLIYTSGTTGTPKGVELLHSCWVETGYGMSKLGVFQTDDKQYLWLPMSHSFGKVLEVAIIWDGIPTAVDGRIPKIVENLKVVQPSFMAAAPRIFEKVYNKVVTGAQDAGGPKLMIFRWALGVGKQVSALRQKGQEPGGLLALKNKIADALVFSKLRATFGGRIRFFISGSAPLSRDMAEFFHAAGILILEGYGLTESSAASFVNRLDAYRFGTVGLPVPGVEVKIDPADGEILLGGPGIMRGYHNLGEVTANTLDDGWLRTGDIGELDADGFLKITDRKKDLIKTSGGKYVAPQALEARLKALCPYVSQVLVHGNRRNFCTALITMDPESLPKWAEDRGIGGKSYAELAEEPQVIALVQEAIDTMNEELPRYSTLKKFAILQADFAQETGELTPSLKVKRKAVENKYMDVLDGFYEGALADV
jgi:long-chain acyl-CoA synthetase